MIEFIRLLIQEFELNADPINAKGQKAYMKNNFEFLGIKSPIRKEIQKPFLENKYLPPKKELGEIVKELWGMQEREFQYFAMEFTNKYKKHFEIEDIELFEFMILHKSWWDSIDFIAPHLVGEYFKKFPEQRNPFINKWLNSHNIWLQRSAILYQLKYKDKLDSEYLSYIINSLLGSKEFFINKAIGWILREYSKINPGWVLNFTNKTELSNLSYKEATRLIL